MAELYKLKEIIEKQSQLIDILGVKAKAFDYALECFEQRYEDYIVEGERLTEDLASGERGYGISAMCRDNVTKTKLIREVICLMREGLVEAQDELMCSECECKDECDGIRYMSKDECEKKRGWQ